MASASETTLQMSPIGSVQMKFPVPSGSPRYSPKEPDFELAEMRNKTHEVVIAIEDTDASTYTILSAPPKAGKAKPTDFHKPLNRSPLSPLPNAVVADNERPTTPPNRIPPPPSRGPPASPRSTRSSPTLVRHGSVASTATHSPVMRSMFPRYDPSVPLTHQQYYPNPERRPNMPNRTRDAGNSSSYSPSLYSQMGSMSPKFAKEDMGSPKTLNGSRPSSPFQASEGPTHAPKLSNPEELLDLWSIANGQGSQEALDTYTLSLSCEDLSHGQETITLSSPSHPLYTLSASEADLTITRTHPVTSTQPTIPICVPFLCVPTATHPLVASIFPKLAELMALDQSSSIAVAHKLTRQASTELQAEALARAIENEASSLLYDTDSDAYYLTHPTLSANSTSATFPISITPSASSPSTISILAPDKDNATPLLTLSLPSLTLTLDTAPIIALPSLYTLDTLLSALLTLLLHLHRSSPPSEDILPTTTPFYPPPPTTLSHPSLRLTRSKTKSSSKKPRRAFPSLFSSKPTTLALYNSPAATTTDTDTTTDADSNPIISFHPLIPPTDPTLTPAQRTLLRTLYWAFGLLVWIQGVVVNLLAAGVVGVGRMWERESVVQRREVGAV